jgi:hypothetical protein
MPKQPKHHGNALPPEVMRQRRELRRSGAAGIHGDRRTKRNRTRSAQRRGAINDQ